MKLFLIFVFLVFSTCVYCLPPLNLLRDLKTDEFHAEIIGQIKGINEKLSRMLELMGEKKGFPITTTTEAMMDDSITFETPETEPQCDECESNEDSNENENEENGEDSDGRRRKRDENSANSIEETTTTASLGEMEVIEVEFKDVEKGSDMYLNLLRESQIALNYGNDISTTGNTNDVTSVTEVPYRKVVLVHSVRTKNRPDVIINQVHVIVVGTNCTVNPHSPDLDSKEDDSNCLVLDSSPREECVIDIVFSSFLIRGAPGVVRSAACESMSTTMGPVTNEEKGHEDPSVTETTTTDYLIFQ